jgi:flagellum-specific ATP synthase
VPEIFEMIANEQKTSSRTSQGVRQVRTRLSNTRLVENRGRVTQMIGLVIESQGPMASVGEICRIESRITGQKLLAEVVGFRDRNLLLMPLGDVQGICPGSEVIATGHSLRVPVGEELLGRVIDGMGEPLDDLGNIPHLPLAELNLQTPHPLKRGRIDQPFETGIKAIDTFVPLGRA